MTNAYARRWVHYTGAQACAHTHSCCESQAQWYMTVIPAPRRQRQKHLDAKEKQNKNPMTVKSEDYYARKATTAHHLQDVSKPLQGQKSPKGSLALMKTMRYKETKWPAQAQNTKLRTIWPDSHAKTYLTAPKLRNTWFKGKHIWKTQFSRNVSWKHFSLLWYRSPVYKGVRGGGAAKNCHKWAIHITLPSPQGSGIWSFS